MHRAVVIVSSNEEIGVPLWHALARAGVRAEVVAGGPDIKRALRERLRADDGQVWGVIVDAADGKKQAIELLRELRATSPELFLVAALGSPNARTTQAVVEAGARDYLIHPFDAEQIEGLVRLWDTAAVEQPAPGRLVCILPARGGDGASTVALHVADAAAREHKGGAFARKVLLVELDFQAGDLAFRLRLAPNRTVGEALQEREWSRSQFRDYVCAWGEVDVLPSPPAGARLGGEDLRRTLALCSSAQEAYPLVVADMPPAIYSSSREVLERADEVFLVCTPEVASVHMAGRRVEELERIGVSRERLRLVLNRAGSHAWIGAGEVSRVVGLPASALLSNDYRALDRAVLEGSVVEKRSPLGRQFRELGREVLVGSRRTRAASAAA